MKHETALEQGLEPLYPEGTEEGERFFYDPKEGKYYDSFTDMYMETYTEEEMRRKEKCYS